jgi:hypothetical protein
MYPRVGRAATQFLRANATDELGRPREVRANLDLPMIVSVGAAYTGLDRWVFAADLRYIDYKNADGFGDDGFAPTGALRGLGFRSIFAAAFLGLFRVVGQPPLTPPWMGSTAGPVVADWWERATVRGARPFPTPNPSDTAQGAKQ